MKKIVASLDIIVNINNMLITSASSHNAPALVTELHENVDKVARKCGFYRPNSLDDIPSRRGGGWAFYDTYILEGQDSTIKLLINVRSADHSSKPNLAVKNEKRLEELRSTHPGEDVEVIDTYYKERDWGAQYYMGKGNSYSDPVDSLEKLDAMLEGHLRKLIDKYS